MPLGSDRDFYFASSWKKVIGEREPWQPYFTIKLVSYVEKHSEIWYHMSVILHVGKIWSLAFAFFLYIPSSDNKPESTLSGDHFH